MIVTKALEVLELSQQQYTNVVILLWNKVVIRGKVVCKLSQKEVKDFDKLMKRNQNIKYINNWVEYIRFLSDETLKELNAEHYYKYEDRGWTLRELQDEYIVDVFLDNYDIENPFIVRIPKSEISDNDFRNLKRKCDEGID